MGLDIYLYKYENFEDTQTREGRYEEETNKLWENKVYANMPEDEKNEIRTKSKSIASELGLDEYGTDTVSKIRIEKDSLINPEHYFKVGYFRSSYNDGGINRILGNLGVPDLNDIFSPDDKYCFQPDWDKSLKNVKKSIKILESKGNYRCFDVSENLFGNDGQPTNEKQALEIFLKEQKRKDGFGDGGYSNKDGHFYINEPIKVLALIPGTRNLLREMKCTYIIMEGENKWYIEALKIVKETIEFVLSQPDKEKYYLHWSG